MKNRIKIIAKIALLLVCVLVSTIGFSQKVKNKSDIKVLYVGYSPDHKFSKNSIMIGATISEDRFVEDMKTRMVSFENLLNKYFTTVKAVDVNEYNEVLSEDFDVTIFDAQLKSVPSSIQKVDPLTGKITTKKINKRLSDNFSGAAILLAQHASAIGLPIGLHTDWYCMCLYGHALKR